MPVLLSFLSFGWPFSLFFSMDLGFFMEYFQDFLLLLSLLSLCFVTLDKAHHTLGHRISRISSVPLEKLLMRMSIATEEGKSYFHPTNADIVESWILNLLMMSPMQSVNSMELN